MNKKILAFLNFYDSLFIAEVPVLVNPCTESRLVSGMKANCTRNPGGTVEEKYCEHCVAT